MRVLLGVLLVVGCSGETICATPEALRVDPDLNATIRTAVEYWADQGSAWLIPTTETDCDVPVMTGSFDDGTWAESKVTVPLMDPTNCFTEHIRISVDDWAEVKEQGMEVRVLTHEVGHLYCENHTDTGVMSTEGLNVH